ncbi:MAG: MerR family transcriptional regulator [Gemmatimonadaceae bacterium]
MDNAAGDENRRDTAPIHGIGVVERKTGVSQYLLRAWERRYAAVAPTRDPAGQRLYSDVDLERIRLLKTVCAGGRRIGQVAPLSLAELKALAKSDAGDPLPALLAGSSTSRGDNAHRHLEACLDAVLAFSTESVHRLLMRAAVDLGPRRFIDQVAVPLLREVGFSWEAGSLRPVQEHAMSVGMRRVLTWLMDALPVRADTPLIAFGTPQNHRHEFGAMMAAIVAAANDCRILYLGSDLPGDEIAHGAVIAGADVVAISAVGNVDKRRLALDARLLRDALPESIPLIIGGSGVAAISASIADSGATIIHDLAAWETWLQNSLPLLASGTTV